MSDMKRQGRVAEETPEQFRMSGHSTSFPTHPGLDLGGRVGSEVGETAVLQVALEEFHGVELGRVGRQPDRVTAAMSLEPGADEPMFVRAPAIPEQDEGAAHVPAEVTKKPPHLGPA